MMLDVEGDFIGVEFQSDALLAARFCIFKIPNEFPFFF